MEQSRKLDVLDFIINVLIEHEKRISDLTTKLEDAVDKLEVSVEKRGNHSK
ncbi:MAG: hypothetical protein JSV27_05885 [Candidatus Bathyarchaeota archaeon]|nr:MAG: hypothetical protein JSV27_05885 [Candidatus Bathyarchaeota archaeon]